MFRSVISFICILNISFLICATQNSHDLASLVIFSYNRPGQLYALLESVKQHVSGLSSVSVLYRTDSARYEIAYEKVKKSFPGVAWHRQKNPPHDFKPLLLLILEKFTTDHVLFAVDDIVVKDKVNLAVCVQALEQTKAYAFYLRLGKNIIYSYNSDILNPAPMHVSITDDIYAWRFCQGRGDWAYPHTVDMTLYRLADILPAFKHFPYHSPNTLEEHWSGLGHDKKMIGLCFETSKIVNIPVNLVNNRQNPYMHSYTAQELLEKFENNLKLDIVPLYGVHNTAAHMDYQFTFVPLE